MEGEVEVEREVEGDLLCGAKRRFLSDVLFVTVWRELVLMQRLKVKRTI